MEIKLHNVNASDLVCKYPGKKSSMTRLRKDWTRTEDDWEEIYEAARERQIDHLEAEGWSHSKMGSEAEERLDARYWHRRRMAEINGVDEDAEFNIPIDTKEGE